MKRKLHIGGLERADGWEILNAVPGPNVDHLCNANELPQFEDNTFSEIYASHILEHFDYKGEILSTLKEWRRILAPGGKIYVSVPDLDVLARLILSKDKLDVDHQYFVMRMLFGGHEYDYHLAGLNEAILSKFLTLSGFANITKVDAFGMFDDASNMTYMQLPISLNLIAEKPAVDAAGLSAGGAG